MFIGLRFGNYCYQLIVVDDFVVFVDYNYFVGVFVEGDINISFFGMDGFIKQIGCC